MKEQRIEIYKLTSPSGKAYIGYSCSGAVKRFKGHVGAAKKGADQHLSRAILKYGAENFTLEVLAVCFSEEEAKTCERAQIAQHGTFYRNGGYNLTIGGDGTFGYRHRENSIEQMRASAAKHTERLRDLRIANLAKNPGHEAAMAAWRGQKHRPETIEILREKSRGKIWSDASRLKLSASNKGRKCKPMSEAQKLAVSRCHKGKVNSPEARAKMSLANRGKKPSEDLRLARIAGQLRHYAQKRMEAQFWIFLKP